MIQNEVCSAFGSFSLYIPGTQLRQYWWMAREEKSFGNCGWHLWSPYQNCRGRASTTGKRTNKSPENYQCTVLESWWENNDKGRKWKEDSLLSRVSDAKNFRNKQTCRGRIWSDKRIRWAKLVCSLRENYVGLSRVRVQNILNSDKNHFRRNAKFLNKATKKPIHARDVQVRYQIDLMDMGKTGVVKMNGKSYRYVLSVIDVFSVLSLQNAARTSQRNCRLFIRSTALRL